MKVYRDRYQKMVIEHRYLRKKKIKNEKKIKLYENEINTIIKEYEELKEENFKLNTAISNLDETDQYKLREQIQ
jgi:hypothetical protein